MNVRIRMGIEIKMDLKRERIFSGSADVLIE